MTNTKDREWPVAYQWLNTGHFRKSIPANSGAGEWNGLVYQDTLDDAMCQRDEYKQRAERAEATVRRVEGLVGRWDCWRRVDVVQDQWDDGYHQSHETCAKELREALGDQPSG